MKYTNWNYGENGEIRRHTKFLLFPLSIGKETRWLETVTVEYKAQWYEITKILGTKILCSYNKLRWEPIAFIDKNK